MPIPANTSMLVSPRRQAQVFSFPGFPYGINKSAGAKQLEVGELVECLNFKYTDDGRLVTRPGLLRITIGGAEAGADIKYISNGIVDVTGVKFDEHYFDEAGLTFGGSDAAKRFQHYVMVADSNYKIYHLVSTNLVLIGTAEGNVTMAPFGGYVMVFDGSYLKYWDGNFFKICYDDGSGASGFQVDYTAATADASIALYSGANVRAGTTFITQDWTAGYTIPLTKAKAMLSKTGSPTGNAVAKLYATTGGAPTGSALATSDNFDVSTITGADAEEVEFTFDLDSTYALVPETTYFMSIEYSGGGIGNCINLHGNTIASTGREYYYDSSWHNTATRNPRMAIGPGRPPKASFGCAWQNRLWFLDPDNPGWARFTNANTPFDFSTADAAGYVGSVDDNAKSFPIGAIIPHYGDLYLIGRREAPYVSKITGSSPSEFSQSVLLQEIQGGYRTVSSVINDIWIANETNVYSIAGVQEHGDIRANEPGNPIASLIATYFDSDAISAFNPIDGQFMLKLNGYSNILVGHTRRGSMFNNTTRYPWTEYLFSGITPTAFGFSVNTFYVGATDGHLYALNTEYADDGVQPTYDIKSCVLEHPFSNVTVNEYYLQANSDASATFSLKFYKNGSASSFLTKPITALTDRIRGKLRFPCRSVQFEMSDFTITKPVNIGGLHLRGVQTEAI
jgi:hypothetical protein